MAIIKSALDSDLYKFSIQQAVLHNYPDVPVQYNFACRSKKVDLRPFRQEIQDEINALEGVVFTSEELGYLSKLPWVKSSYIESLQSFKFHPEYIKLDEVNQQLSLRIYGNWYETILFEVPVLAIIEEVYTRNMFPFTLERETQANQLLIDKITWLNEQLGANNFDNACSPFLLTEMGTRRRYSRVWQETVIRRLAEKMPNNLIGTSNVYLAKEYKLKPVGTMAHEWLQAHQALAPLREFQQKALEVWMHEYRGWLGIALSDVVGFDAFLVDFDMLLSKAYDGARHDSGDPSEWGKKLIAHYEKHWIDPRTKTAVFSDGLDFEKAFKLYEEFNEFFKIFFGIGTYLTNDMGDDAPPLSIVIKMVECCGEPVAKLSDSPGKEMCDNQVYLDYLRQSTNRIINS
jgi:nicotinate phosphoribosyltransferase